MPVIQPISRGIFETNLTIASLEAWLIRLPFDKPIRYASGTWDGWSYIVVRTRTDDGREAASYSFIGEIPLDLVVTELLAPRLVGTEIGDLRSVAERCAAAAGPALSDVVRPAASLVEVCLWDLAAQAAGVPLWRLLCDEPARAEAPLLVVEHRREGDTPETFGQRVAGMAADGVQAVKIKHYSDAAETAARLAAIRDATTEQLDIVVDVGWMWPDLPTAVRDARAWEEYAVAWIEDPFPPTRVKEAARLREAIEIPIGIGDMLTNVDLAERLIDEGAVDVLRVDVTTMGGIAGVERLVTRAAAAGVDVSPELLAELHQHLAFAWPAVRGVEIYSPASGIWGADAFLGAGGLAFEGAGRLLAPEAPGSGLDVDWDAVERRAARFSRYPAAQ
jgi:L-alanine-DL-glutamate epimerase-like enolase superfamily enzyme